jgi:hypothetical protein
MVAQFPSLWPEIQVDAPSPLSILKYQASQLVHQTKGLLEASVRTSHARDGDDLHEFVISAMPLNGYKYTLFRAWNKPDLIYPITIEFRQWADEARDAHRREAERDRYYAPATNENQGLKSAATPGELKDLLSQLFSSQQTKGVLNSLISRINEMQVVQAPPETSPSSEPSNPRSNE